MINDSSFENNKEILKWRKEISTLRYEEMITKLDQMLCDLQDEDIPIDDLQSNYIKASMLVEKCEKILNRVEQDIVQINPETLSEI